MYVQNAPEAGAQLTFSLQRDDSSHGEGGEVPVVRYWQAVTTDADGHYRAPRGFPGAWTLRVTYPAPAGSEPDSVEGEWRPSPWQSCSFNIDLTDAETTALDIGRDGVDVIGRVVIPDGITVDWPFSGVELRRKRAGGVDDHGPPESYQVRLSTDGTFRCFNVRPGDYTGTAIIGSADDPVWSFGIAERKRGFEAQLQITADRFAGKSVTDSVDLGEIPVAPVD